MKPSLTGAPLLPDWPGRDIVVHMTAHLALLIQAAYWKPPFHVAVRVIAERAQGPPTRPGTPAVFWPPLQAALSEQGVKWERPAWLASGRKASMIHSQSFRDVPLKGTPRLWVEA
ncbi:hypothetical protein AOLI_G00263600 [Acnodon oligacanthus]